MKPERLPADLERRAYFEYLNKIRRRHGTKTLKDVAEEMHLTAPSRISALLSDHLPVNESQAEALLTALGGSYSEIQEGLGLYRIAESLPADPAASRARGPVTRRVGDADDRVGRPVREYASDPHVLDIHDAIDLGELSAGLAFLPPYTPRRHDSQLADVVRQAVDGKSAIAVLVGDSSTGKTSACWEAVRMLGEPWRLWFPLSPDPAEALLADLHRIGPHTIIWLNNAQQYLAPAGTGERVAAGLRGLLTDAPRGPVLVLGTIWPRNWINLTADAVDGKDDPRGQARALMIGSQIGVPGAFSGADLDALSGIAAQDARLSRALAEAKDGRITQFLAGIPALVRHYRDADHQAKALIHAAMDARRLGVRAPLPLEFLVGAAPGYMTDVGWQQADEDRWLEDALDYAGKPCCGVLGPLYRDRPRTRASGHTGRRYRLAEYLEQVGSTERAAELPPATF